MLVGGKVSSAVGVPVVLDGETWRARIRNGPHDTASREGVATVENPEDLGGIALLRIDCLVLGRRRDGHV